MSYQSTNGHHKAAVSDCVHIIGFRTHAYHSLHTIIFFTNVLGRAISHHCFSLSPPTDFFGIIRFLAKSV